MHKWSGLAGDRRNTARITVRKEWILIFRTSFEPTMTSLRALRENYGRIWAKLTRVYHADSRNKDVPPRSAEGYPEAHWRHFGKSSPTVTSTKAPPFASNIYPTHRRPDSHKMWSGRW